MIEGKERYLFVADDPRDILLGCVGTANKLIEEGKEVFLILSQGGEGLSLLPENAQLKVISKGRDFEDAVVELVRDTVAEVMFLPLPFLSKDHYLRLYTKLVKDFPARAYLFYEHLATCNANLNVELSPKHLPEGLPPEFLHKRLLNSRLRDLNFAYSESFYLAPAMATPSELVNHLLGTQFYPTLKDELKAEIEFCESLIGYTDYLEKESGKMQGEIAHLKAQVSLLNEELAELKEKLRGYEWAYYELEQIKSSNFYRAAQRYYRFRDKLLPTDSSVRKVYEKIVKFAMRMIHQSPKK